MASPAGRGAQVILDGAAQAAARGAASAELGVNASTKRALEEAGTVPDGSKADGSTQTGLPAEDPVLGPAAASTALDALTGSSNADTGTGSAVLGGDTNTASGSYSTARGRYASDRGKYGRHAFASGRFGSTDGSAQGADAVFFVITTDDTPTKLTADGSAGTTTTELVLPANTVFRFRLEVAARDTATGDAAGWLVTGLVKRGALVSNMAFVDTPTVTSDYADTAAETWALAVTLDTTLGGMFITATGAAATTIHWVARVFTTECG
jgi:hypothetical protein